ncbi:MAG: DUF5686 family protein [Bacteroidota bacterium]|nr:DUF5686 family protein [Bacteroidota bacterium]
MKIFNIKNLVLVLFCTLLCGGSVKSQTQLNGQVLNSATSEAVPYASVSFLHTTVGTVTDDNGAFFTDIRSPNIDSVIVSCLGFINDTFPIISNQFQEVTFHIEPQSYDIDEVVVVPGENPAHILWRKVLKHKKINNPAKFDSYSYSAYTKMQLDLNNFDPRIQDTKYMSNFSVVFEGLDTASNGKIYMPMFLSESISKFYSKRRPKKQKEIIEAVKLSGVENKSISAYTGGMYTEINFYENFIDLFEKQFVSPVSFNGLLVYKYYLTDSAYIDSSWCRQITFRPRRKYEYTFEGDFWVAKDNYALKKVYAKVSNHANIDYVQDLYIKQSFEQVSKDKFFPTEEEFFADFNIENKTSGFFTRKYTSRKNVKINPSFPKGFFSAATKREIITKENAKEQNSIFWSTRRHKTLTQKEQNIYMMTDSIKKVPAFQQLEKILKMAYTGYYPGKYIEYGPVFQTYTFNQSEGNRLRIGGRTSNRFSEFIEINAYGAFGISDQKFKYGSLFKLKLNHKPRTLLQVSYNQDMIPLGASFMTYSDNLFSSVFSVQPNDNLLFEKSFTAVLEQDIAQGFYFNLFANHKIIFGSDAVPFIGSSGESIENLTVSEAGIIAHIGFNEEFVEAIFTRISLGSVYPIVEISYTKGFSGVMGSSYDYSKINFFLTHRFFLGSVGKFQYNIEAGKLFGQVPFPLLKLFPGNESYLLNEQSFNLLNVYEFAADEYISVFLAHHFQSLFLNKLPLIRRLKWREVAFFRAAAGNLSETHTAEFQFPGQLTGLYPPYMEAGLGLENIFKIFRIDGVWRLSHRTSPNVSAFGIRFGLYASF